MQNMEKKEESKHCKGYFCVADRPMEQQKVGIDRAHK